MEPVLKISETAEKLSQSSEVRIKTQIKITNTSKSYLNNMKLIIKPQDISILEQSVIRQRGSLSYDTLSEQLDLGNLAPDETAYFECAFTPLQNSCTLSKQLSIHYTPDYSTYEIAENITDLLDKTEK